MNLKINQEHPGLLTLAPSAFNNWHEFQKCIETQLRPNEQLSACLGWGGKICNFALRIAGLLHITEHGINSLIISDETMAKALEIAALLSKHAIVAYGLMGIDQATEDAKEIFSWIATQGKLSFTQTEITYGMRHKKSGKTKRLVEAITVLIDRNIISKLEKLPTRKPTTLFHVNPVILKGDI